MREETYREYLFKTLHQLVGHPDHGISSCAYLLSLEAGDINQETTLFELLGHRNEAIRNIAERELVPEIQIFLGENTPTNRLITLIRAKST